jgi:hypothetical protein
MKIRKAIAVKVSRHEGNFPVPLFGFGPEDLARYTAAIDELSDGPDGFDDKENDRPRKHTSITERVSDNPHGWTSNSQLFDSRQFFASGDYLPPAHPDTKRRKPADRAHHRQRSLTSEPHPQHKRSRVAPKLHTSTAPRGLPRAHAFRESGVTSREGSITVKDSSSNSDDSDCDGNGATGSSAPPPTPSSP